MHFEDNAGAIILRDEKFDLKVTPDRKIYIRYGEKQNFNLATTELVPEGFSYQQKKEVLVALNSRVKGLSYPLGEVQKNGTTC
jgi:uncharacterized protein YneR